MTELGTLERPLRIAIIGSGPSGFYAAEALFKKTDLQIQVDMFERLPVPYGLVRSGVAPDHPKIKTVTKVYQKIAAHPQFSFIGNVEIGKDLQVDEIKAFYDALIFTCGAATDRKLNIPGIELPRSYTATEFVAWYNGHPDYRDHVFDLSQETAVIIGQGNVAVDVCRILAKSVDELKSTDIAQHALAQLAESNIKDIYMVGRRGPAQAAFTPVEAKELGHLEACDLVIDPQDLALSPTDLEELALPEHSANRKNFDILKGYAEKQEFTKPKRLHLKFFLSPLELHGETGVEAVQLEKNQLSGPAGKQSARGTGETLNLKAGLFFRSVGYRGVAMPGVPFNEDWGVFKNDKGKIEVGMYTAGWIKRGPSGIIGTNKPCSYETVESLIADLPVLSACSQPSTAALLDLLASRNIRVVSYTDWEKIDAAEVAAGERQGKPREKFTRVEDMLALLN